jgi:hypothetical protein
VLVTFPDYDAGDREHRPVHGRRPSRLPDLRVIARTRMCGHLRPPWLRTTTLRPITLTACTRDPPRKRPPRRHRPRHRRSDRGIHEHLDHQFDDYHDEIGTGETISAEERVKARPSMCSRSNRRTTRHCSTCPT